MPVKSGIFNKILYCKAKSNREISKKRKDKLSVFLFNKYNSTRTWSYLILVKTVQRVHAYYILIKTTQHAPAPRLCALKQLNTHLPYTFGGKNNVRALDYRFPFSLNKKKKSPSITGDLSFRIFAYLTTFKKARISNTMPTKT